MARARRPNEPSSYEAQPEVPAALQQRFDVIRAVLGGKRTISEAAVELGIARVNMQTLVHRVEAAILETLQPRPTGRAPKDASQKQLEARLAQLTKDNEKLTKQLLAADDMMMAAGEIIRDLRGLRPSSRSSSPRSKKPPKTNRDEDPERTVKAIARLQSSNNTPRVARLLGLPSRTLRRWLTRLVAKEPIVKSRSKPRRGTPESEGRVRELVASLHGLPGAASLAKNVSGISRRRAGEIKCELLAIRERDRKSACHSVEVLVPGVIRGFDAMHFENGYGLNAADASVPFRTSTKHVPDYDAKHVAETLEEDFETHGAPLVLRVDRARCHTAPAVMSVLEQHCVIVLQGPAYYAQYYGQHERQNREHRAWCAWLDDARSPSQADLDRMKNAFNELWRRPTLGWRTAAQCWNARPPINDDRAELRDLVQQRIAALQRAAIDPELAMRLAIEQALTRKGYIRIIPGRRVLCE